jgi:hypothetical protein
LLSKEAFAFKVKLNCLFVSVIKKPRDVFYAAALFLLDAATEVNSLWNNVNPLNIEN